MYGAGRHQGEQVSLSFPRKINRTARWAVRFYVSELLFRRGHERPEDTGHLGDGHGLEIDVAGAGDDGVENALSAEHHVLEPRDRLDVHGAGGVHGRQVSGVHHQGLAGVQVILHDVAVELREGHASAGELLHDEPLAAEEAGAQLLLEEDGQLDARLAGQEAALLHHQLPARADVKGPDAAGEAGGKGDQPLAALGGVAVLEDGVAGEHPAQGLPQPAVGAGLHLHVGSHPAHAAPLGNHGLAGLQLADHHRQRGALDLIFHGVLLSLLGPGPVFSILPGPLRRVNPNRAAFLILTEILQPRHPCGCRGRFPLSIPPCRYRPAWRRR